MQSTAQDVVEIEVQIEALQEKVALKDAVHRLTKNRDFKKLFTNFYFKDYAARLVALKADPSMGEERHIRNIENQLITIGGMQEFLRAVEVDGFVSENAIASYKADLDEINGEKEEEEDVLEDKE